MTVNELIEELKRIATTDEDSGQLEVILDAGCCVESISHVEVAAQSVHIIG